MSKPLFIVLGVLTAGGGGLYGWAKSTDDLSGKKLKTFEKSVNDLKALQGAELRERFKDVYTRQTEAYQGEETRLRAWFGERRDRLNAWFGGNAPDPANFKVSYLNSIRDLSKRYIAEAHANQTLDGDQVSTSLPHFLGKWGNATPPDADLAPAQRQYNILEGLLYSLAQRNEKNEPYIHLIEKITIVTEGSSPKIIVPAPGPRPGSGVRPPAPANPFYTKIPVEITCQVPMGEVNSLLHNLLTNPHLVISIDEFSMEKIDGQTIDKRVLKNGLQVKLTLGILEFNGPKMQ